MKKWFVLSVICLSVVLCACGQASEETDTVPGGTETVVETQQSETGEEIQQPEIAEETQQAENGEAMQQLEAVEETGQPVPFGNTETFSGYQLQDGAPLSVTVSMKIEDVLRGEEAYAQLLESVSDLSAPGEGEEYIVITIGVSYDEGEAEELALYENIASLPSAALYFAMPGAYGNAENLTSLLPDSIYNCTLKAGESVSARAAFLHGTGEGEPLVFAGFDNVKKFSLTP